METLIEEVLKNNIRYFRDYIFYQSLENECYLFLLEEGIKRGYVEIVEDLLYLQPDKLIEERFLVYAVNSGNDIMVKLLLSFRINFEEKREELIKKSLFNNYPEIAKLLINNDYTADFEDFLFSIHQNDIELFNLLHSSTDLSFFSSQQIERLVIEAIWEDHLDVVKRIYEIVPFQVTEEMIFYFIDFGSIDFLSFFIFNTSIIGKEVVNYYLEKGGNKENEKFLLLLGRKGTVEGLELIIDKQNKYNVLLEAAYEGNIETIDYLSSHIDSQVFYIALFHGHVSLVNFLLSPSLINKLQLSLDNNLIATRIAISVEKNQIKTFLQLLSSISIEEILPLSLSYLYMAVRKGNIEIFQLLLYHFNYSFEELKISLIIAIEEGRLNIVQFLIGTFLDLSPLQEEIDLAARRNQLEIFKYLSLFTSLSTSSCYPQRINHHIVRISRNKLMLEFEIQYDWLTLFVLLSDGYLQNKDDRFFKIISALPYELQLKMANVLVDSKENIISTKRLNELLSLRLLKYFYSSKNESNK